MRLCGIDIPYAEQNPAQAASDRIHNTATTVSLKPLDYDNRDIACTLYSTASYAEGILRAVQKGNCLDVEQKPIDIATVIKELHTLSADLERIANVVKTALESEAGKIRWPEETPKPLNGETPISIRLNIKALNSLAEQFKDMAKHFKESGI